MSIAKRQSRAAKNLKRMDPGEGELPHEFLLRISQGQPITQRRLVIKYYESGPDAGKVMSKDWVEEDYYPDFQTRVAAAKSAAPYFAPRLASQTIDTGKDVTQVLTDLLCDLSGQLPT